ncbi:MAG: PAS domain S-box protein [Acidobacteria bacterium]|nr:PAS domain S-box protein [Acidobacteriota bacterium]
MLSHFPITDRGSAFTDLLLEWIDDPLLLVENGAVVAANDRACELCGRSRENFAGMPMGAAIDLLYHSAERLPESIADTADVEVHRLAVEGRPYQVAVMRLPSVLTIEESLYRRVLQRNFDAYWITTDEGRFLDFSDSYAELTGYTAEELRQMTIGDVDHEHAGWQIASRVSSIRRAGFDQFEVRQKVGECRFMDLEIRLSYLPRAGGHVVGCVRDITAIRRAQSEATRSERTLGIVEASMRLARTGEDRKALLDGVCAAIVDIGRYPLAWIAVPDPGEPGLVRAEAAAGQHKEYLDEAVISIDDTLLAPRAEGDETEPMAVCNDFASADFAPWREQAIRHGFASSLSLPLKSGKKATAALNIYASEPDAFTEDDIRALAQVVEAIELGLEVASKRAKQKAIEQHATDWDDSFRAAFEQSLNGMVVYGLDGHILDANAEFCSRMGYTRQELLAMHMTQIVPPEYAPVFSERLAAVGNDGFAAFELPHVSRDGSVHPLELTCRTYAYGDNQIVLAIVRRPDQPAQATSESVQLAVQASRLGLFDWDLRTNKVVYSNEWKALFGYGEEEIGDDFGEWELRVHQDDVERMVADLKAYLETRGRGYEAEFRMRRKDGAYRWILARGAVLYGADGQPERMLGSHADITDRKRLEQQNWQSRKLEAVSRLAAGVSHDLNDLLTIINGYSELILPGLYEGDPLKERIQAIREAGERASRLTGRLTGLSPRHLGAARVVNLNSVVTELEDTLHRLLGEGVVLETNLSTVIPYLRAEPSALVQLVMQLAVNARESMPEGGKLSISVRVARTLPPHMSAGQAATGPFVSLIVSDTGAGVDEETRLQLFDPFFHRGPVHSGNLALPAVYGIVKQHGGMIAASSDPGKGTEFQVYFPLAEASPDAAPEAAGTPAPNAGPRAAILLVERDPALRRFAAEALRASGYAVQETSEAGEALLYAESHPDSVQLLVSGQEPTGLDGRKLAERIGEYQQGLRALWMSSEPPAGPGVVVKPFTPAELAQAVQGVLSD